MLEQTQPKDVNDLRRKLAERWEWLIAVKTEDQEQARLGRLFNILMVISTGIVVALSSVFLLMQPLGLLSSRVSWVAAAFPLAFIPLSLFCLAQSRRGHVLPMVRLYVWVNLIAISIAIWLFDGVYSPGWMLYIWTISTAGILMAPAYALWMTAGVLGYFLFLWLLSRFGFYTPLLTFSPGREFLDIAMLLIMLISTVGFLTYLNMRSLREVLRRLRESEAMYRNVFDNAGDIIFTVNKDTIYTSLNPAFAKITGWPTEEWVGKSFVPLISQSDLPLAGRVLQRVLQGQAVEPFELHVLKNSGEYLIGEFSVTPLRQDAGVILLGICRDVTERKKMEEQLRESEQKFRAIFDTAPDGIFTVSTEGRFTSSNPAVAQLMGWTFEDLAGTPYAQWLHPDDLPLANQIFLDILSGQPGQVELRVRSKAGGYKFIEVSATPRFERGSLAGALGFFRDISERKQMEEMVRNLNEALELKVQERTRQLLEAQEELIRKEKLAVLGQVVGSVGHELRNPLGVINNAVYYLQAVLADADETTREYLGIIREEIAGADHIVADLLDSVRTKPPQTRIVSAADLIEQTLFKLTIPAAVELRRDIPESIPPIRVDPMQMQQVFRNLISNAVDAMPEGGVLEIRVCENPASKTIGISVRDTGIGVAEQDLAKLFQPLFTTKARGIGLGLVVVKNLTVANGGSVEVQSEPGKGALFTITLPCDLSAEKTA